SHLDADGISAVSILIKALDRMNMKYSISIVQQLNADLLREIAEEGHNTYIFTDLGSGSITDIKNSLKGKTVIVLDHHDISPDNDSASDNDLIFVNPHLYDIDGGEEISGSGVVYLFAKEVDPQNKDMAHIAVVGAIGDIQEKKGFKMLNNEILKDAIEQGLIEVKEGLRIFGYQTRPLHKVLEYCSDPYIPGVSGNESRSFQFLNHIGIEPKNGKDWRTMSDLDDEEMKRLIAAVIMKRINEKDADDVLGCHYIIKKEKPGTPLRDGKEFATLLNACGRLDKASLGIGACIGDEAMKKKALKHQLEYRKEIVKAMNWFRDNKNNGVITRGKGYAIINAGDSIIPSMIGTMASMLTKGNEFEDGTLVMGLARQKENTTKISLRIASRDNKLDLTEVVRSITEKAGGEAGGHMNAAGAVIKTENEAVFLEAAKEVFENRKKI
ncbi:MAG: DHH family phosphoesterase, partial [Nanoarchaeota archaeon]|nr:DHH family phosphoesterase [Nanoarchaeota archaeon]